jgi:hypothetical protein
METLPAVVNTNPVEMIRQATDVAGACKAIVVKAACTISGRKYIKIEGWQSLAVAHGCILSAKDVQRIEGGYRATGEVRRISDGAVLATAEGFLGDDEKTWANRGEYAKRAMVQTRAMSRAGRSAFAHVVVMMDAGLETTPAEEIPTEDRVHPTEQNPQQDQASFKDAIVSMEVEQRPGKKDKTKIYTIYRIQTANHGTLSSFSEHVGLLAEQVQGTGEAVIIHSKPGKYGNEIEDMEREGSLQEPPPNELEEQFSRHAAH